MGQVVQAFVTLAILCVVVQQGLHDLSNADKLAQIFSRRWQQEYLLRRCIYTQAARQNITTAGQILAEENPSKKDDVLRATLDLAKAIDLLYPKQSHAPEGDEEICCNSMASICFELALERHAGQPSPWPNFVPRLAPLPEAQNTSEFARLWRN